jgi:hypothetical protein
LFRLVKGVAEHVDSILDEGVLISIKDDGADFSLSLGNSNLHI